MVSILLVNHMDRSLAGIVSYLKEKGEYGWQQATSGLDALKILTEKEIDLVIADETLEDMTGLELINKMVKLRPMTQYALVSSLSSKAFHDASEGLGILMQLPVDPGKHHGEILMNTFENIFNLLSK